MMKINRHSISLIGVLSILAVLALFALTAVGQPVSAHEAADEAEHEHTPTVQSFVEDEANDTLTLAIDVTAVGAGEYSFVEDDDKIIWQYVGPSATDEVDNCHQLGWTTIEEKAKQGEAEFSEAGEFTASLSLDLRADADGNTRYCFRVPLSSDTGAEVDYFFPYTLQRSAPVQEEGAEPSLVFSPSSPAADSDVPASVTVEISGGAAVVPSSWGSLKVDSAEDCSADNTEAFNSPEEESDSLQISLGEGDAGAIVCVKATTVATTGDDARDVYGTYQVPSASGTEAVSADDENTGVSWLFIIIAVILIGAIVYFIVRSMKSKE